MPSSPHWFYCTEEAVCARLNASANDPKRALKLFRDDYKAGDHCGGPQIIATGPSDGVDDSRYSEAGFSWRVTAEVVMQEMLKLMP